MSQQPERGGMPTPHPQGIPMVDPAPVKFLTSVSGAQFQVIQENKETRKNELVLKEHVVVFNATPAGVAVCVWDLDAAEKIAKDIYAAAYRMRTRLIVPDGESMRKRAQQDLDEHVQGLPEEEEPDIGLD